MRNGMKTGGDESGGKKGRQQGVGKPVIRNIMNTGGLGSAAEGWGGRDIKAKKKDGSRGAYDGGRLVTTILIKI